VLPYVDHLGCFIRERGGYVDLADICCIDENLDPIEFRHGGHCAVCTALSLQRSCR
jgi:hypothetical protein